MTYSSEAIRFISITHSKDTIRRLLAEFIGAVPTHPLFGTIHHGPKTSVHHYMVDKRKEVTTAISHEGDTFRHIIVGDVEFILHISDLSTDEREDATLTARKYDLNNVYAIATATSGSPLTKHDGFSALGTIEFIGFAGF